MTGDERSPAGEGGGAVDVSAIVVTYQSHDHVLDALASIDAAVALAACRAEIVVVDNASLDGTADLVAGERPDVRLVRNPENVGFGAANNQAFELATGRFLLLLNPDARLERAALARLLGFLEAREDAAAAGPSISGPGSAESAGMMPSVGSAVGHFLFVNRLLPGDVGGSLRGFQLARRRSSRPVAVEWLSGAAVALRTVTVRAVGGFDASIFMYGEDLDLCARLSAEGGTLWLLPDARATHEIGGSGSGTGTAWLGGIDGWLRRSGAGRLRRAVFFLVAALGLALRAGAAGVRAPAPGSRTHGRRLANGAGRAVALSIGSLIGRGRP